jgi:DNA mismatch repair ATPase MutS
MILVSVPKVKEITSYLEQLYSNTVTAADFIKIKEESIIVDELAKALYKNSRGDPSLKQIKDLIYKCDKLLFEEFANKLITYNQALNRQFMKNAAAKTGNSQTFYCLDDFLDLPTGKLFKVSEKEHHELSEIMNLTLRKNKKLKTYNGKLLNLIFSG